ncbi:copper amine oxidase N-terminal domain-containing protein [Paenibacillus alkaliterrae]|uniref:stalk domain-containing protein n=1 Tax=Paenibacillus alkaliterrae TaxID=320909 RepID=UPI001F2F059F|nr:stalk domain-containing protein [Paenibacillus alkaliterrae]MCF2941800.1 copper amine oxidase N-terminal domain-containing protein [Paenibacillus alkaliterrae]
MKLTRTSKKILAMLIAVMLLPFGAIAHAVTAQEDITSGTTYVVFYIDKKEAFLDGEQVMLDAAPVVIKGKTFVPAKFLGDAFGMKVEWIAATRTIVMETPKYDISLDFINKSAFVNGYWFKLDQVATIVNGRLMIKLTWLSDYMGATYTYNSELKRIDVLHVRQPEGIYDPEGKSSRPVAKFNFAKDSYRIGEPVKYVNLSYDPDAEALKLEWEGKEEAFFKAGTYPITLTATDKSGQKSAPYTRNIVIEDEVYLSKLEYPIYTKPVGGYIETDWSTLYGNYFNLKHIPKQITEDTSRSLLLSDSPETFTEQGILYQDSAEGKTRLYANHQNGAKQKLSFAILATNMSDQPVTVKTTRKGEVYPTIYALQMGSEATVDFLMNDPVSEKMTIPPGETFIYKQFPDFYPGQGVNLLYDVESDGKVQYTFAVANTVSAQMLDLPKLPFNGHIRGTFPITAFDWKIDVSETALNKPMLLAIGDGKNDPFQKGFDPLRGIEVEDPANYGTVYKIHAEKPRKMAIIVVAKGGAFKGPFKVNGEIRKVPGSGVLTAFDGMVILAKTTGKEESLDIEFSPPAGSSFPINLIFYPLDERAE